MKLLIMWECDSSTDSSNDSSTAAVFNAVGNKIPSVSDLVKKTDYFGKTSHIETGYFNTSDHNKFKG